MNTMLEFITYTKGIEYLIAISFIIIFFIFWQFMHGTKMRRVTRTMLVFMLLGLGTLASTLVLNGI